MKCKLREGLSGPGRLQSRLGSGHHRCVTRGIALLIPPTFPDTPMSALAHPHASAVVLVAHVALDVIGAAVHVLQAVAAGLEAFLSFFR